MNIKAKRVQKTRIKTSQALASTAQNQKEQLQEQLQNRTYWRKEIEALTNRRFGSLEEALEIIADNVLSRLGKEKNHSEEKEFLLALLRTDMQLCEIIRDGARFSK